MATPLGIDYVDGASLASTLDTLINARLDQVDTLLTARSVMLTGTNAARLAYSTTGLVANRAFWFSDDLNGGTLWKWDGAAWVQMAPGVTQASGDELGYAEITSALAGLTSTAGADLTGLTTTVTVGTRPIEIVGYLPQVYPTAGTAPVVLLAFLVEDGTQIQRGHASFESTTGSATPSTVNLHARRAPSAGSHTYKITYLVTSGSTWTVGAAATQPPHIFVKEC